MDLELVVYCILYSGLLILNIAVIYKRYKEYKVKKRRASFTLIQGGKRK